jgi:quercetin dioxygenase-like cupin family protein
MTPAELIKLGKNEGPVWSVLGDKYRILATGEQTGGAYMLLEARVSPGGGPPPHFHLHEEEAFYVIEGELSCSMGGEKFKAGPGAFVQFPRKLPHTFKNEGTGPARFLVYVTPAGFEKFLAEIGEPLPSFDSPPVPVTPGAIQKLLAVTPKYGIQILPPG